MRPSGASSILLAAGTFGRPGMVMMSPQTTTTNSAPAESRTSRIGMVKPDGAPLASGLVEKLYCVLATQIGSLPKPSFSSSAKRSRTLLSAVMSVAP